MSEPEKKILIIELMRAKDNLIYSINIVRILVLSLLLYKFPEYRQFLHGLLYNGINWFRIRITEATTILNFLG